MNIRRGCEKLESVGSAFCHCVYRTVLRCEVQEAIFSLQMSDKDNIPPPRSQKPSDSSTKLEWRRVCIVSLPPPSSSTGDTRRFSSRPSTLVAGLRRASAQMNDGKRKRGKMRRALQAGADEHDLGEKGVTKQSFENIISILPSSPDLSNSVIRLLERI